MKQCTKCKKFKKFCEFDKDKSTKDGYCCQCKSCRKEYVQEHKVKIVKYRQGRKIKKAEYDAKYSQEHKVKIAKYQTKYHQEHKTEKAEYGAKYRQGHKVEIIKYRQEHKVEIAKQKVKYAQEHKLKIAEYQTKYEQEHKVERAEYRKNNPDKMNARAAKRRALKLKQIPPGTDLKEVAKFYELAQMLSIVLGYKMHVDHYIPLSKGGLHCPENLRIIPALENLAKGDKMPSEFYNQETK